jgi:tetratricopeptide (TPR) repeat protein
MALRRFQSGTRVCVSLALVACAVLAAFAQAGQQAEPAAQGSSKFQTLLQQGFQLHQQSRFAEAIPVLEMARRLEPGDYFANLLLGIDLLRSGKAVAAVPRLKLAARTRPNEEFPEDYLGEAHASLGEYALAAEAYQGALLRGHNSEQALEAWAGFALERFRQIGEGLRASQEGLVVARRLRDSAVQSELGAAKGCEAGIPTLERRLVAQPAKQTHLDSEAAYRLSICYAMAAGKAADRLQVGQLSSPPATEDMAAVYKLRGDVLLRLKGDGAAAEAEYNRAIAIRPGDPALLERLAQAQLSAGNTEGARQSAQAAIAIDPHRRDALRTLAALAMNNREYGEALPLLRQLAVEAPGDKTIALELGRALAQTGDNAQALEFLAPVLAAGYPDEKGASHALLARVLRKLGRDEEAAKAETDARRLSDAYQARSHASGDGEDAPCPPRPGCT